MRPVKKLVLATLEKHSKSANATLAVSSVELACTIYRTQHPTRAQSVATRRALNALAAEGHVDEAFWTLRRPGHVSKARYAPA
jgi:hypothetical protein